MKDFAEAFALALKLIGSGDADLWAAVSLSLQVSLTASLIAFVIGAPIGGYVAVRPFPGRTAVLVLVNALLGLPPVVVGLAVYILLSQSGPLGAWRLLFTPLAMILAQTLLTLPIVIALTHRATAGFWERFGDSLTIDGASHLRSVSILLAMARAGLITAFLAAFGRAIAEVGAIMMVGGNIRSYTRTMTTAIALETSKGNLALALALGLILICLALAVSAAAFLFDRRR
ncbi:MAG: tungstate transport system permease protein [Methylobacteriaceae bacterium]|nr:tungstate transport system permease protein [Methylobacteriaceae bacterium]